MEFIHYPWASCDILEGDRCVLSEEESRHLRNVLRCKEQELVVAFNGNGGVRLGKLIFKKRNCEIAFTEPAKQVFPQGPFYQLIQFLPNNVATFEDILRKTCELGISAIYPIYGDRSEPKHWTKEIWGKRTDRFQRILIESCKQAKNPFLPKIYEPKYLNQLSVEDLGCCFHGSLNVEKKIPLDATRSSKISCIIGPEGGFSSQEELVLSKLSHGVCLPTCVLRVETAVVGLISVLKTLV